MINYIKVLFYFSFVFGSCTETPTENKRNNNELKLVWEYEYQDETKSLSRVSNSSTVIDSNMILTSLDASITALNIGEGNVLWRYKLIPSTKLYSNKLEFDENNVYVKQERSNQAVTLDVSDGNLKWSVNLESGKFRDQPSDIQSESHIYLNGDRQDLYVYKKNGDFVRRMQFEYSVRSGHYYQGDLIIAHAYRDIDESAFAFGELIRYDLTVDTIKWKYQTNNGGFYLHPILLDEDIIYAGTTEGPGEFTAVNASTGQVIWRVPDLGAWAYTINEGVIFINDGADLVALRKTDGQQIWRTKFPGGGFGQDNIAYMDGYVYHSHSGSFFVLDAHTGEIVYSTVLPDGSYAGNVSAGFGKVFVQSDFHLYAYKGWEESE